MDANTSTDAHSDAPHPDAPQPDSAWPAERVRRLRTHVGETQEGFAGRLGTRQQTVSAWERGESAPRRMARRLLHLVAEKQGFYRVEPLAETMQPTRDGSHNEDHASEPASKPSV